MSDGINTILDDFDDSTRPYSEVQRAFFNEHRDKSRHELSLKSGDLSRDISTLEDAFTDYLGRLIDAPQLVEQAKQTLETKKQELTVVEDIISLKKRASKRRSRTFKEKTFDFFLG